MTGPRPDMTHADLAECIANVHRRVAAIEKQIKPGNRRLDKIEKTLVSNQERFGRIEETLTRMGEAIEPLPEISASLNQMHELLKIKETAEAVGRAGAWTAKTLRAVAGVAASIGVIVAAVAGAFAAVKLWAKGIWLP